MRAIRLWKHLFLLKRGGIGLLPGGVSDAEQGSCAIVCPACPRELPDLPEPANALTGLGDGDEDDADDDMPPLE